MTRITIIMYDSFTDTQIQFFFIFLFFYLAFLKKAGGHIGRNAVEITIKMKTIVRKLLMIKIIKLCLRNLDN